jgi:hypothetical protein
MTNIIRKRILFTLGERVPSMKRSPVRHPESGAINSLHYYRIFCSWQGKARRCRHSQGCVEGTRHSRKLNEPELIENELTARDTV